jgi:hypothetical protein
MKLRADSTCHDGFPIMRILVSTYTCLKSCLFPRNVNGGTELAHFSRNRYRIRAQTMCTMKHIRNIMLIILLLTETSCVLILSKETRFLKSAENRATQEEVQQQLGQPVRMLSTEAGDSVWVYHIYDLEPGAQSTWSATGSWCDEYVLVFDRQRILREWTHRAQRHGGENMPTYCVANGFLSRT